MDFASRGVVEYGAAGSVVVIPNPPDRHHVIAADAQLLFTAEFRRACPDLVLTGLGGRHPVLPGSFAASIRLLWSRLMVRSRRRMIDLLIGSPTPSHTFAGTTSGRDMSTSRW